MAAHDGNFPHDGATAGMWLCAVRSPRSAAAMAETMEHPPHAHEHESASADASHRGAAPVSGLVGRSLRDLSHEARNELYAIMLRAYNARGELDDGQADQVRRHLADIASCARKVDALIKDLVAVARSER